MSQISLIVDGVAQQVEGPVTGASLFADRRDVVVVRVDGELRDLAAELPDGAVVEGVTIGSPDGLAVLRHSTTHVLAQAVQEINPSARLGIGPPITDGFYYDFDVESPFTPEDLKALEKVMARIVKEGQTFRRWDLSEDEAREVLADEPYKLELIGLKGTPGGDSRRRRRGGRPRRAVDLPERPQGRHRRVAGPVPRPAPAQHPTDRQRLPAHPFRRRLLARIGEEPPAPAGLRHGVAHQGRAARPPGPARRGRAPRPPAPGQRAGPVQLPRRDRLGAGGLPPEGRHRPDGDGGLRPAPPRRGRLLVRQHPAHHQGEAVRDLQAPGVVRRGHVPPDAPGRGASTPTATSGAPGRTTTSSR